MLLPNGQVASKLARTLLAGVKRASGNDRAAAKMPRKERKVDDEAEGGSGGDSDGDVDTGAAASAPAKSIVTPELMKDYYSAWLPRALALMTR